MERVDGDDAVLALRQAGCTVPAIAVTGNAGEENRRRYLQYGFQVRVIFLWWWLSSRIRHSPPNTLPERGSPTDHRCPLDPACSLPPRAQEVIIKPFNPMVFRRILAKYLQ